MFSSIDDVKEFEAQGPYTAKSGGRLDMLLQLPLEEALSFLSYEEEELKRIPEDIRGLRIYSVRDLASGSVGGKEFHKLRKEVIVGIDGIMTFSLEDAYGKNRTCLLTPRKGIYIPPFIMHTYETIDCGEKKAGMVILANTLFWAEKPSTHDTYSWPEFHRLQYAARKR